MKNKWIVVMAGCRAALIGALAVGSIAAQAVTLRIGNQGDALSMDPYSLNETLQSSILANVYEPLVYRNKDFKLTPALATDWKLVSPTVWRFFLRKGVVFHDGTPFTADDVLFSFERVKSEGSDMNTYVGQVKTVKKVDDYTVDFVLRAPFPILPESMTRWLIMSKKWCQSNGALKPVDRRKGLENAASTTANGTGPYKLVHREHDIKSVYLRNERYWDTIEGNVDEVIYLTIPSAKVRVDALLSNKIDVAEPIPLLDVARVNDNPRLQILQAPEARVIFLGMDVSRDELLYSNVKGKNPFKDKRVRQAFYQGIDIHEIRKDVMNGAALPTGMMLASHLNGYIPELEKRLPYAPEAAKKLLADAGYPEGFEIKMNCPTDRYVNDAAVCQAIALQLAKIGVTVSLEAENKAVYFPKLLRRDASFFMLGWNASTGDVHNVLFATMMTPAEDGQGAWNFGGYSNARLDALSNKIASEIDPKKRHAMVYEALKIHQDDIGAIPLHRQALTWGAKKSVELVQWPDNGMPWKYIRHNP